MRAEAESTTTVGRSISAAAEASRPNWLMNANRDWPIMKLSYVALLRSGHTPSRSTDSYWVDCLVPWITLSDVKRFRNDSVREIHETDEKISIAGLANSSAELLPKGTVILSRTASVGFSTIMGVDMATTQDFANWVCGSRLVPEYLWYCLKAMRPEFKKLVMGSTHKTIYMPDIGAFKIAVPEAAVQRSVVEVLDRETARIDTLISKQKQLIELLKEKRQAVILQAVTKGLDPIASMKRSGVEWLGDVPKHWKVCQLRRCVTFQRGHDLPSEARRDGNVPVVTSAGVSSAHDVAVAKAPGIVTGRYGTIGKFTLVEEDYWPLNTTLYSIDLHGNDVRFLRYMLVAMSHLFLLNSTKSAVPGVDRNDLHCVTTVSPSGNAEQQQIVDYLDAALSRIDDIGSSAKRAIGFLEERRGSLVSAAVTGQIDVTTYDAYRTDKASAA